MKVIVIASNKGGTGKTTMSCALAESLAEITTVALLDADVTGPDVATVIGTPDTHAIFDLDHFYPVNVKENLQVFSPSMIIPEDVGITWSGELRGEMIRELLERVEWTGDPEYLIIDSPPSTADELVTVLLRTDPAGVVIVTLGAKTSINDAKRLIAVLENEKFNIPIIGYVRNMVDIFGMGELDGIPLLGDVLMGMPRGVNHIRDKILERLEELK
jgi:ATP-binding protein involved in chromosome partitioning